MPESADVSAGDQLLATQQQALRDDALRMLLAQGIGASEILISTGALTISSDNIGFVTVGAQTGSTDQLDTMTVASLDDGDVVALMATAGDEITIADSASTGGFSLGGIDLILTGETIAVFVHKGTTWYLVFQSWLPISEITFNLGSGFEIIYDGEKVGYRIPWDCELIRTSSVAPNESGTIRVEFWMESHALQPATVADEIGNVSLSSAQTSEDTALAGWTVTRFVKGEWIWAYVDGDATSITQMFIALQFLRAGH